MTRPEALPVPPTEEEEQAVLEFLRRAPDFFVRHAELLAEMPVRHGSGGAVSLIERQVRVLREKNHKLGERLDELLATARQNEVRVKGMNHLARSLIEADSLASVIASLNSVLHAEFSVEAVCLGLFELPQSPPEVGVLRLQRDELPPVLTNFFRQGQVVCEQMSPELNQALFSEHAELKSVALVPLDRSDCLGVLALASTDPDRFRPSMGQLFLEMTANLCTAALRFHGAGSA